VPESPTIIDITPPPKAKPKSQVPNRSRPRLAAVTQKPVGAALDFLHDGIEIEEGHRTEMADAYIGYLAWCKGKQLSPMDVTDFADDVEKLCREVGIRIRADDNCLLNVRLPVGPRSQPLRLPR
jgi:hypothetical protein